RTCQEPRIVSYFWSPDKKKTWIKLSLALADYWIMNTNLKIAPTIFYESYTIHTSTRPPSNI
ncbi:hypothetical protein MXB_3707, partial [Myxobolus squamalis]